jgi:prevent-host-death family protein
MDRRVDASQAQDQFGQLVERAVQNNERFVVDLHGEPAVVIMSVRDFIRIVAPAPDWLEKAWAHSSELGLDQLTMDDIDREIAAYRKTSQD